MHTHLEALDDRYSPLAVVRLILLDFSRYTYIRVCSIYNCISPFPQDAPRRVVIVIRLPYNRTMMMMMWDIDNNQMKYALHLLTHDAHGCQRMRDIWKKKRCILAYNCGVNYKGRRQDKNVEVVC